MVAFERLKIAFKIGGIPYLLSRIAEGMTRRLRDVPDAVYQIERDNISQYMGSIYDVSTYKTLKKIFRDLAVSNDGTEYMPQKQRNKVWWCWLQGEDAAPPICRACLSSLRQNMPDKEIVVLTEKNIPDYAQFPDHILKKYKGGAITRTHFSDLLRLELLIEHGGTWIDSTVLCTSYPTEIFEPSLFVYQRFMSGSPSDVAQSWVISSDAKHPILIRTKELLYEYWLRYDVMAHYFLFYIFFRMAADTYPKLWEQVPIFPDAAPHLMGKEFSKKYNKKRFDQLCALSNIHKLSYKTDIIHNDNEKLLADYILERYLGSV